MAKTGYNQLLPPEDGEVVAIRDGKAAPCERPVIPYIEGDGIGPDIMRAARMVWDRAVELAYGGKKYVVWFEIFAGEKAQEKYGELLPEDTLQAIRNYHLAIKGPLTTPVGGGFRSLNVTLRQVFDLYACIRPVRHFRGVPSPVVHPEKLNVVIFRENTEDVYAGIEWPKGSRESQMLIKYLEENFNTKIREDSGIGIKPISEFGSQRLVRMAIRYALERGRRSVTLVHKGNIMKYTEGAFRDWGYAVAKKEFPDVTITEAELWEHHHGEIPPGKILIKDRIADSMFQQVLLRPDEYEIIATPNLNGDYLSDACAAQVGGLGIAPGANIGDEIAVFEATHGTAPKYAGQDKVNPTSLILSGVMMFEFLGWQDAADLLVRGIETTIAQKYVTYDIARQMEGATEVRTSVYGARIVQNMETLARG